MRVIHLKLKQTGATLILMAFIIGLVATVYLLKAYDPDRLRIEQDKKTYLALNEAKQALIAWAVSHPNTPGLMPYPDRNGDGNYDDRSDCYAPNKNFDAKFTIGRLPLLKNDPNCNNTKQTVAFGLSGNYLDGSGEKLWYEVSGNLLHDYNNAGGAVLDGKSPIINPSIINATNWLAVVDRNGSVVSNRVAAVIIAPGPPIGNQSRSGGIANANHYLDKIVMANGKTYQNYGYPSSSSNPVQEFIIGDDYRTVAKNDPSYKDQVVEPYLFNDKLVYVTIDELIAALSIRAANEAVHLLKQYKSKTGQFPYAANLGSAINSHISSGISMKGMLPIDMTDSCVCVSSQNCKCSFKPITSVTLTLESGNGLWKNPTTQSCVRATSKECTCTGAGRCDSTKGNYFKCDLNGQCDTDVVGNNKFSYIIPSYVGQPKVDGACIFVSGIIECNDNGAFDLGLKQNTWFKDNLWQDYFYYEWSSTPPYLQVGNKNGVNALLIATGQAIGAQSRPPANSSPSLGDYLDSVENTNGDNKFDATTEQKTNNYNDQTFIVQP